VSAARPRGRARDLAPLGYARAVSAAAHEKVWQRARWLLLALAGVLRMAYRFEAEELPFVHAPLYDSGVYLQQAEAVRAGRFSDPTLVAFGPAYGWWLALVDTHAAVFQLLLGLGTAWLVERTATRLSGRAEGGVVALALWIGYAVPLFYETKLMSETLGLFLVVLATWLASDARWCRGVPGLALASGGVLGLATLTRANLLFALPFFVIVAALRLADELPRARALRATCVVAGMALVLGANGLWNLAHVGRFVPVILTSQTASRASSHGAWTGSLAFFGQGESPPNAWDVVAQAERALAAPAQAPALPSIDVGGWIAASPSKLARTFSDVETSFDYGFYGERSEVRSLSILPVSMGVLLLLGALGAVVVVRRDGLRGLAPHLPLFLGVVLVTTLFHPSTRYRLSMAVPLVLLSAEALLALAALARQRRVLVALVAAACVALAVRHLAHPLANPGLWQVRVAEGEVLRGDVGAARARIARALATGDRDAIARIALLRGARALPPPPP
jgi:hypothetical protein